MFLAILAFVAQATASPAPAVSPSAVASPAATPVESPSSSPLASPSPSAGPSTPPFSVAPATIELFPAAQRRLLVTGATAPISVTDDRRLVSAAVDAATNSVVVTATQATGRDTLHITDAQGATVDVPVRVAFLAGTIAPQVSLKVTGSPLDPQWLAREVGRVVSRATSALPGAQTAVAPVTPVPDAPSPGAQSQIEVPVRIAGGDAYFDAAGTTVVTVRNVAAVPFFPPVLFYDDDPERINADGVVFRGTIDASHSARLYYYHDGGQQARRVVVLLATQSANPSSVHVIDSTAGPNIDVMSVGHAATRNFLDFKARNQGTIVDVDATAPFVLDDVPLQYREGVSGSVGLNVLSGGPVTVTVLAVSADVDVRTVAAGPRLPGDGHNRSGAFAIDTYGTAALAYQAGGPDVKIVYGDRDPTPKNLDPASSGHDYGDYGVLWNIAFTLSNPTPSPATVYLYERPIGGIARSSFLVDGKLIEIGCVKIPVPYEIGAYELQPSQTYRLNVATMTDGGSNYPIEVGMTAVVPQPSAPPINSANGCFPK